MTDTVRTLIVDDEPLARRRLRRLLDARADIEVIGECSDGREAVDQITSQRPDLLLLDIRMPDLDGFGVLGEIPQDERPLILFVTAHDDRTLDAFGVAAVDYLLKPFDQERFDAAIDRALERHEQRDAQESWRRVKSLLDARGSSVPSTTRRKTPPTRFSVRQGERIRFVELSDIEWFEAAGSYVRAHTASGASLVKTSLKELETQLADEGFVRIHRTSLVRSTSVVELHPLFHGEYEVRTRLGARLKLSRTYRGSLERLMTGR